MNTYRLKDGQIAFVPGEQVLSDEKIYFKLEAYKRTIENNEKEILKLQQDNERMLLEMEALEDSCKQLNKPLEAPAEIPEVPIHDILASAVEVIDTKQ